MADGVLPPPDAVISAVGTAVHDRDWIAFADWSERLAGWDGTMVREALRPFRWLVPQDATFQSTSKCSFEVADLSSSDDAAIRRALTDAGIPATVVCSGGRYVDVIPGVAGKGRATRFLADRWSIAPEDVLVFGDSGNDADMLNAGFRGTMVANAEPDLRAAVAADVYRSPRAFADGVIDGATHWSLR